MDSHEAQTHIYLPDILAAWPWPRKINPHHREATAEANAWFKSLNPLTPESQYAFDKGDFGRLAALCYPDASPGKWLSVWTARRVVDLQ